MPDHLEAYLQEAAPEIPEAYPELQRVMMQEVLKLSAEAAGPAEREVESAYRAARAKAEEGYEETRKNIEEGYRIRRTNGAG
jgi:hypothetical protein